MRVLCLNGPKKRSMLIEWQQALDILLVISNNADAKALLSHPKLTKVEQMSFFNDFSFPEKIQSLLSQFLLLLIENRRLGVLGEVSIIFSKLYRIYQEKLDVTVSSFIQMDEAQLKKLKKILVKRFNKKIDIYNEVDKNLLGGFVIKAENIVIDFSVKSRLRNMIC